MTTRNPVAPLKMPPYEFDEVPVCNHDLSDSVVVEVTDRDVWLQSLAEMLLLCNDSARRRFSRMGSSKKAFSDGTHSKPLGLEYIADRIDIDDPLRGYQVIEFRMNRHILFCVTDMIYMDVNQRDSIFSL